MSFRKKIIIFVLIFFCLVILAGRLYFVKNNFKISGVVVPHHNLVAGLRAEFFENLAKNISAPKTIILLSPNHYNAGQGNIQTSDKNWNLNQGQINADKKVVSFLVENNLTVNESPSFVEEHGIYNILSDIHNNFPNAKLVPIIFENASADQINKLEQGLKNSCAKCLMIASVDFSHDQPIAVAQINDGQSITDLQKLDSAGLLENAKVDSPPALALLAMWAKDHNTLNFILKNHIGSGANLQNPGIESVTHVFGWYENK